MPSTRAYSLRFAGLAVAFALGASAPAAGKRVLPIELHAGARVPRMAPLPAVHDGDRPVAAKLRAVPDASA